MSQSVPFNDARPAFGRIPPRKTNETLKVHHWNPRENLFLTNILLGGAGPAKKTPFQDHITPAPPNTTEYDIINSVWVVWGGEKVLGYARTEGEALAVALVQFDE